MNYAKNVAGSNTYWHKAKEDFNPFTPGTLKRDNPPIPWEFWPKNLHSRTREVNHMRSKPKDNIKFSNKLPFEVE